MFIGSRTRKPYRNKQGELQLVGEKKIKREMSNGGMFAMLTYCITTGLVKRNIS
jgi:hypothetical protein